MGKTLWVFSGIILTTLALSGCGHAQNTTTQSGTTQAVTPTKEPGNTTKSNTTTGQSSPTNRTQTSNSTGGNVSVTQSSPSGPSLSQEQIQQILRLASGGQIDGIPFVAGKDVIGTVNSKWGQQKPVSAGAGLYETFTTHHAAFGFNKGEQIFDIRSYQPTIQSLRASDVKQALGNPGDVRTDNTQTIWMYPAGPDFQLLWIFDGIVSSSDNPHVDHISVFYPQGTVNSMAATQPAPSVVMDSAPGQQGELTTFSIQNAPKGYRLIEFVWQPKGGQAVVDTYQQAVKNGQTGNTPGFEVSGDGKTLSFVYTESMKGQQGTIQVIYQNPAGQAMIGQSQVLTLK